MVGGENQARIRSKLKGILEFVLGDQRIALPLDIHPQGMYCNAKMLREAGWTNPDGLRLCAHRLSFTLKQAGALIIFQLLDLMRQRRLGQMYARRRAGQRAGLQQGR